MTTVNYLVLCAITKCLRQRNGGLLPICLLLLLVPCNELLVPILQGRALDTLTHGHGQRHLFACLAWFTIVILIIRAGLLYKARLLDDLFPDLQCEIKAAMLDELFLRHDRQQQGMHLASGEIVYLLSIIPDITCTWVRYALDYLIPFGITYAVACVLLWRFDRPVAIGFALLLVFLMLSALLIAPYRCLPLARRHSVRMGALNNEIEDIVSNMEAIYSTNQQTREVNTVCRSQGLCWFAPFRRTSCCARRVHAQLIPVVLAVVLLCLVRIGSLVHRGHRSRAAGMSMALLLLTQMSSLWWLLDIVEGDVFDLGHLLNANDVFAHALNTGKTMPPPLPPLQRPPCARMWALGLVDVTFRRPGRTAAILQGVNLNFGYNQRTVFTGGVGAGKTTVLRLLLGLYRPSSGQCYLMGRWHEELDAHYIRAQIGYVPQQPTLFDRTLLENVQYGTSASPADIEQLMAETGLLPLFPNGLATPVGRGGMNLSGGQRQLIWCLRTLLQAPTVLLLDEPTSAMDAQSKKLLFVLLDRLLLNRTVVVVSHDPYLLERCDHHVVLPPNCAELP